MTLEVPAEVQKALEQLEEYVSELEFAVERQESITALDRTFRKILDKSVTILTDRVIEKVLARYSRELKSGNPHLANEVLLACARPLARIVFLCKKTERSMKNLMKQVAKKFRIKLPEEYIKDELEDITASMQAILKSFTKAEEAKIKALEEALASLIRPTNAWSKYLSKVPGLTAHTVGILFGNAPPHRFDHFGKYRVYIGTAPREYYRRMTEITGKQKHWHPIAKQSFYVTVMLVLIRRDTNKYYRKIFEERYNENASKLTRDVDTSKLSRSELSALRAKIYFYALKETVDIFAHHFWYMWRKAHGMYVERPYPVEKLNHRPYYPPAIYENGKYISIEDGKPLLV